jgi:CBS domain-containing protein
MDKPVQLEQTMDSGRSDEDPNGAMSFTRARLKVRDILNPNVVTVSPAETVLCAAKQMCHHRVSCVVVVDGGSVVGLLTQKDLVLGIAQEQEGYCQLPVAERMSSPVLVAPPDMPVLEAAQILRSSRIKHLPIVAERKLVGIVTQTDITRGLIYMTPLQRVCEVMNPHVTTIDEGTTVVEAAQLMAAQKVSCVVVTRFDEPVGILTQKDILMRVILLQGNPTRTSVGEVMSSPILPIPPDYSVFAASRAMDKMSIHRLVVNDAGHIRGIVSQTDILHAVERRLVEEERRRLLLVCSDVPMFMLDATAVVTYVNIAFLSVFDAQSHEELVGRVLSQEGLWSSSQDRERLLTMLEKGRSGMLGLVARTATGRLQRTVVLLTVTKNTAGEIIGWQGVAWPVAGAKTRKKALCRNSRENTMGPVAANPRRGTTAKHSKSRSPAILRYIKALFTARTD